MAGASFPTMQPARRHTEEIPPQTARHDIICALAHIANAAGDSTGTLRFHALPPDQSLFDAPTFAVDILQGDCKIGTYKFNVLADHPLSATTRGITFSPLVIQWAESGKFKQSGMDKAIIGHCLQTIKRFIGHGAHGYDTAVLTTAYPTKQRAGKTFFEEMGWQVIEYDTRQSPPQMAPHLVETALRIEALSAPHRTSDAEMHHACFAYIVI